ncbi:hypothetical protein Pcaca03_08170 [Pectobacterium carotovorum subsp. carotovorum]|uniref:Uncharacterized protein n=1 Tax=Pectobacterium carotovorum subsp. carotovorum TaxID=555 RepID=A0AAI9PDE0_PECCC|nr:hypothetical protein SOASR016_08210 [Pectobacterium carotovorum subsp. carotovorum]GLV68373.1 hypothetical protein Pcaca03_08170 [Pectobacterium carotovorum subsp. carotovorum]
MDGELQDEQAKPRYTTISQFRVSRFETGSYLRQVVSFNAIGQIFIPAIGN